MQLGSDYMQFSQRSYDKASFCCRDDVIEESNVNKLFQKTVKFWVSFSVIFDCRRVSYQNKFSSVIQIRIEI